MTASYDIPVVLDRREGPYGEVVLRRHGELLQIIANGCFLMDTADGRSERLLVDAAREALGPHAEPNVLIGGLGVGFSLAHAAADPAGARSRSWNASGPSSTGIWTVPSPPCRHMPSPIRARRSWRGI